MSEFIQRLLDVPGWTVLVVAGAVVFAEDALFIGFVLPGETVAVLTGVAAKLGHVSLTAALLVVALAAIAGDSVGYLIGRRFGGRVLALRILDKRRARLAEAQDLLARRGGTAVFLARWVAFLRAVMPALAGSSRMPFPTFLMYNAAGAVAWGITVVLIGYAAGASYAQVEERFGVASALVVAAVVVTVVIVWRGRRHGARGDD